eukprot:CAMPEP_0172555488 /NCGR_PEP_ID=MMETSP1067-20121228/58443_1 /TAXON_ID=265564 ORGANISM="Thalassiosira punctigera, Strain Tpunct2005C2" /NCGR_SAMPLE_ID=MMETSP1067 /ASSEMBLY_ACC=CAM_ASM_000444 /LENGTH=295 /DNA_ID=CAMNT_0013344011 /DNA_START=61 /DNA_END=948 /DNA_ORIENTATION=+
MTMNPLVDLMTMNFPYATEIVCVAMAIQGSMNVRNGPNKSGDMHWFHALLRSTLAGYAGATFTNVFMGRPSAMFSNDVFFGSCLIGYGLVNWTPLDVGYYVLNTFPGTLFTTVFAQVFRVGGVAGFSDAAFNAFKDNPSVYYPTPVFGPILFPSMLGNMGGFFTNGIDAYVEKALPWMIQQSVSCSAFYHFYAHDAEGYIGVTLRSYVKPLAIQFMALMGADGKQSENDALFARFMVGCFMVVMGILRMPQILGPRFSPFMTACDVLGGMMGGKKKKVNAKPPSSSGKKNKKKNQ